MLRTSRKRRKTENKFLELKNVFIPHFYIDFRSVFHSSAGHLGHADNGNENLRNVLKMSSMRLKFFLMLLPCLAALALSACSDMEKSGVSNRPQNMPADWESQKMTIDK